MLATEESGIEEKMEFTTAEWDLLVKAGMYPAITRIERYVQGKSHILKYGDEKDAKRVRNIMPNYVALAKHVVSVGIFHPVDFFNREIRTFLVNAWGGICDPITFELTKEMLTLKAKYDSVPVMVLGSIHGSVRGLVSERNKLQASAQTETDEHLLVRLKANLREVMEGANKEKNCFGLTFLHEEGTLGRIVVEASSPEVVRLVGQSTRYISKRFPYHDNWSQKANGIRRLATAPHIENVRQLLERPVVYEWYEVDRACSAKRIEPTTTATAQHERIAVLQCDRTAA